MLRYFDRIAQFTPTVGQGTVSLGTAISNAMLTLAEAGAGDGDEITFLLEEGDDFEISRGVIGDGVTTVTRATVQRSKIGGVAGTSRMELAGNARFRVVETADTFNRFENNIGYQALLPEIIKTAGWTATPDDAGRMLVYNGAAGGTVTLPLVAASNGEVYHYRCVNTGALTIDGNGAETVEGAATLVLPRGCSALVWANEGRTGWRAMVTPSPTITKLPGAAGSFLRYTGADTAVMQAIVGSVSQLGGVPTGAIIERGSNASGQYIRFADGTQICWNSAIPATAPNIPSGPVFTSAAITWLYPAAFADSAVTLIPSVSRASARWVTPVSSSATEAALRVFSTVTSEAALGVGATAVGRWF